MPRRQRPTAAGLPAIESPASPTLLGFLAWGAEGVGTYLVAQALGLNLPVDGDRPEAPAPMKRKPPMIGVWAMSGSAVIAEGLVFAGYDFVVLDMEHAPNDAPRMLALLQAMAGTPASAVVRLQWNDSVTVKQVLDFGAQTLMFPYIQDAEEARRSVSATRYPPDGVRGFAGMSRATRYGSARQLRSDA